MAPRIRSARIIGNLDINALLSFAFGIAFLVAMLAFATGFPNPTQLQVRVFVTVLALSAAGIGAVLPGYINVQYKSVVRAGGALGLFAVVYWFQPTIEQTAVRLVIPPDPPEPVAAAFLSNVDAGDVTLTWQQLDPAARDAIVPDLKQYERIYKTFRHPLGTALSRDLIGVDAVQSPSGYPIGIYRSLTYRTRFSQAGKCRSEGVILRASQDLKWRVFNHRIAPDSIDC